MDSVHPLGHSSPLAGLVVDRGSGDVVIGVEERLGEQGAHMAAAESVYDSLSVTLSFHESGESQFRQVLAGDGRAAVCDRREA